MKKINYTLALFVCLLITSTNIKAQGNNLQFNSAVHYTYSVAGDGNATIDLLLTTTIVVPANKVLKIENAYSSSTIANGSMGGGCYLLIENVYFNAHRSLPSGTYSVKICDNGQAVAVNHYAFITGILYNIVP